MCIPNPMSPLTPALAPKGEVVTLIQFYVSIDTRYDPYEAFVLMTLADYKKYFCKENDETIDPFEAASNTWDGYEVWVPELSGKHSQDNGNIDVYRLDSDSDILDSRETDDDEKEVIWNALEEEVVIDIDGSRQFREEIQAHVREAFNHFKVTQTISFTLPEELVPTVSEFVNALLAKQNT